MARGYSEFTDQVKEEAEVVTMTAEKPRGRGRPRGHSGAKEREDKILAMLKSGVPMTRNQLADALGMQGQEMKVYLALRRLKERGRVVKCAVATGSDTAWMLKGQRCP